MKKGIKILLMSLFLIPIGVSAATVDVSLSCPESANADSEVTCTIKATPNGSNLKGLEAKFNITGGTYVSFSLDGGWIPYSSSSIGFSIAKNEVTTTSVNVGTLKVKMPSSGNAVVKLVDVAGTNSSYDTLTSTGYSKTIRVKSNINTLESLSVTGATITFDKNTTTYNVTVDAPSTTISATKTDKYSTINGAGNKNLNYGNNTFNIDVLSETGSKKTYTININRPDNRSTNNNLSSLKVNQGKLNFNKNTTTYNVDVGGNITNITVEAVVEDSKASLVNGYGNRSVNLNYGNNTIEVKVVSEKGTEKVYTINVNRKDDRSTNNNLSSLKVNQGKLNFNKNTTTYNVDVGGNITNITVEAAVEDPKASLVNGYGNRSVNLNYGKNIIEVKVVSEKGTEKVYTINVNRKDDRSTNNNLSSITLSSGNLQFDKATTEYQTSVENEVDEIRITAKAEDPKAKVEYTEISKLQLGNNEIKIKVTAENGSTKEYRIVVIRKEKNQVLDSNNYLKELKIDGYEIDFKKEKTEYNIIISDEEELKITFLPESNKAMATMTGNEELNNNSIIKISVFAENGSVKEYNIYIDKVNETNNNNTLYIGVAVFIIGLVAFGGSLYYFKRK